METKILAATHTISIRLREEVYENAKRIAERRHTSLNALAIDALSRLIREEEYHEMFDAATLIGQDAEECSVEYAFAAQADVVLADGYGEGGEGSKASAWTPESTRL